MSRTGFIIGLCVSVGLHAFVLLVSLKGRPLPVEKPNPPQEPVKATVAVATIPHPTLTPAVKPKPKVPTSKTKTPPVEARQKAPDPTPVKPKPQLPLQPKQAPVRSTQKNTGSFAGTSEGQPRARLRINWGSAEDAYRIMQASQMKLVALDSKGHIHAELVRQNGRQWHRQPCRKPAGVTYTDAIRIVDRVPAFIELGATRLLHTGEHLGVLVPLRLETRIQQAKIQAATQAELTLDQIDVIGGHFQLLNQEVYFHVDKIKTRTLS